jgi:hypothetical protein
MTTTIASLLSLVMILIVPCLSDTVVETYPLRSASATPNPNPQKHRRDQGFLVTFSDDAERVNLQRMTFVIAETTGELSTMALEILQLATKTFLEAELTARLSEQQAQDDTTTTLQMTVAAINVTVSDSLIMGQGTQVQVDATVELDGEAEVPSDQDTNALNVLVADITQDLQYWVTNVTNWQHDEFDNLNSAVRTDVLPTLMPTAAPATNAPTKQPTLQVAGANQAVSNSSDDKELNGLVPAAMVAAGVFILTALLIGVRRRHSSDDLEGDDYSLEPRRATKISALEAHVHVSELEDSYDGHTDDDDDYADVDADSPSKTPYGISPLPHAARQPQTTIQMQDPAARQPQTTIQMQDGQTMIHLQSEYMTTMSGDGSGNDQDNDHERPSSAVILSCASRESYDYDYDYDDELEDQGPQLGGNYTTHSSPLRDDQSEIPYSQPPPTR